MTTGRVPSPDFMIRRNNPILLGILSKLRKRLPPADGESHVVTLCTSSHGSAHKLKVTKPVIKVSLSLVSAHLASDHVASMLLIKWPLDERGQKGIE